MNEDQLKLEHQICFPIYASSRLITKLYQPLLNELDVTYPQYLVLLVLWENDHIRVKSISEQLILESNTLTPLLKRMEKSNLITRKRIAEDERIVIISLTEKGKALKEKALSIPTKLLGQLEKENIDLENLQTFKTQLSQLLEVLKKLDTCRPNCN